MALIEQPLPTPAIAPFAFKDDPVENFIDNGLSVQKLVSVTAEHNLACAQYDADGALEIVSGEDVNSKRVEIEQKALKEALQSFTGSLPNAVTPYQQLEQANWKDVIDEIANVQKEYNSKGARDRGFVQAMRGRLRSFSKVSQRVDPWLQLLPSESWQGSLICGSIKVVLQAAQRIEDMRVDICDAIEAIPEVIEKAQNFGQLHPTAAKLRDYTAKLYVAILKVLHLAIGWYGRKCSLKAFDAFVHGKAYDRELSDALQTLKRLEGRIEQEAGLQDQFQDRRYQKRMIAGQEQIIIGQKLHVAMGADVLGLVHQTLAEIKKEREWRQETERCRSDNVRLRQELKAQERRRDQAISEINRETLVRLLEYRPESASKQLAHVMPGGYISEESTERVAYIAQRLEVARWLASPDHQILIMNGHEEDHDTDSATSLFSAMLLRGIAGSSTNGFPMIHWFCGERDDDSIRRMLQGLLAQLLSQMHPDADVPTQQYAGRLQHVGDLTRLLVRCLDTQLQHSQVFCVWDGVSFYEDQYRGEDLCHVFTQLVRFVRNANADLHPFRLLLTSPRRSMDICETSAAMHREYVDVLDIDDELDDAMWEFGQLDLMKHAESCLRLR